MFDRLTNLAGLIAFATALSLSVPVIAADNYIVGVVPQFATQIISSTWEPLLEELAAKTGDTFELVIETDITQFEVAFERGDYDIAYMNPWHAVIAFETQGYVPIVKDGANSLKGILIVKADSEISEVSQLDNAEIAFPSPNALSASLLMRTELATLHGLTVTPLYVRTHPSVYLNVALGKSLAGGGVLRTLRAQPQSLQDQVKIIYETREVSPHPIVAHRSISPEARLKIANALLDIAAEPEGAALFAGIPMQQPTSAKLEEYLALRDWRLREFYVAN
jgi:phosphonate transport system substrate-binding protein